MTYYELITKLNEELYEVKDKLNMNTYSLSIANNEIKRLKLIIKIIISCILSIIIVMLGVVI